MKLLTNLALSLCFFCNANVLLAEQPVDFRRQIQPILTDHCSTCHGLDAEKGQGGLRLDLEEFALKGGDSGSPAIIPGKSETSELIKRILTDNADEVMPPPHEKNPLTDEKKALLKRWIDEGAKFETHWAFAAPVKRPLPSDHKNPIDAFVASKLKQAGFDLAPQASKNALARRIYLDTVGVPPTPTQLDEFIKADAEAILDRLLASEGYGEKWARHWLDVARYSDTNGYEKDMRRDQWAWRDWVVSAINKDLPYDQFIIEQIAGDLLPNATQDQMIATGFLRNSMLNEEGAIVPEQFRMVEMFDRLDCLGKATLGLTTQCALCHSHKFDPLTQDEYFGIFAFLNNSYEAQSEVYSPEQRQLVDQVRASISQLEEKVRQENPNWQAELATWSKVLTDSQPDWKTIEFDDLNSVSGLNHPVMQMDGSILMTGHSSADVYMIGSPNMDGITGLRLEVLPHGDLPMRGPGRSPNGTWQLHTIDLLAQKPGSTEWEKINVASVTADYSQPETKSGDGKQTFGPVANIIDGKPETFWTADRGIGRRNQASAAVLAFQQPLTYPAGTRFKIAMHMGDTIGSCRFSFCHTPQPVATACDHVSALALAVPEAERTNKDNSAIFTGWRKAKAECKDLNAQIEAQFDRIPAPYTTVLHLLEREQKLARKTNALDRGEWDKPKKEVVAHVPAAFHSLEPSTEPPRLQFARWLVDRRSPLAARVAVNRVWQAIFGDGLVETAEDFGTRTAQPEQVELLDYLAVDFMEHQWSQKHLIKTILMSNTYQQSSAIRPDLNEKDSKNRLLGRGPRFRAEAEVVRDIALSVAGLLHSKSGGPSIIPPVPQNVLNFNYVVPTYWAPTTGPDRYRRALYVFRKRSMPDPFMSSFDSPNGDFACARRVRSNTPLAALAGLNETIFVEAAQALSLRILKEAGKDDDARIEYGFLLCTSRKPRDNERIAVKELLAEQRKRIADGWLNPREITTGDASKVPQLPDGTTPQDAAAWTIVSRVLLNLDETISKN